MENLNEFVHTFLYDLLIACGMGLRVDPHVFFKIIFSPMNQIIQNEHEIVNL